MDHPRDAGFLFWGNHTMTMMLTSGSMGRANLRMALEKYERLFAEKFGKVAGEALVQSTASLEPVKRLWELERLYTGKERRG